MNKFKVFFYYEEQGYAIIEAKNIQTAEDKIKSQLELDGLDGLDYEVRGRDYDITMTELYEFLGDK